MAVMSFESLPLGFRFHPTDEELITHYLRKKINGRGWDVEVIPEVDVCKWEPWDLPLKSLIRTDDPEWFFFCPRDPKYPTGNRSNRATHAGYWKATGKDRNIKSRRPASDLIGTKKTLVFYRGRAPSGIRTGWIMHEYRLTENKLNAANSRQAFVLCRLFKKTEEMNVQNCDEVEHSGFSPATTKSSPDDTQDTDAAGEQFVIPLNQRIPESDMQEGPVQNFPKTVEKQPVGIERWLADKSDNTTSSYPAIPEGNIASAIEDDEAKVTENEVVDPMLEEAFSSFYEPTFEMLGTEGFSQMHSYDATGLESCMDSPLYDDSSNGHMAKFQGGMVEEDVSISEFLDAILSNDENSIAESTSLERSVIETAIEPSGGLPYQYNLELWKSVVYKDSGSSCDAGAEVALTQVDPVADISSFYKLEIPHPDHKDSFQAHSALGSFKAELPFDGRYENGNMGLLQNDSVGPDLDRSELWTQCFQPQMNISGVRHSPQCWVPSIEPQMNISRDHERSESSSNAEYHEGKSALTDAGNMGLLRNDGVGLDFSFASAGQKNHIESQANFIPAAQGNTNSDGFNGTGIKIRARVPLYDSGFTVLQGNAPRRIRLQMKISRDCERSESSSDAEDHEGKSALTDAGETVGDTATTGTGILASAIDGKLENLSKHGESHLETNPISSVAIEFQTKSSLDNSVSGREFAQESNQKLRLRMKQSGETGSNQQVTVVRPKASNSGFSYIIAVFVALIILIVLLFVLVWR